MIIRSRPLAVKVNVVPMRRRRGMGQPGTGAQEVNCAGLYPTDISAQYQCSLQNESVMEANVASQQAALDPNTAAGQALMKQLGYTQWPPANVPTVVYDGQGGSTYYPTGVPASQAVPLATAASTVTPAASVPATVTSSTPTTGTPASVLATISPSVGTPVESQVASASSTGSWFTDSTMISGVPNWALL